MLLTIFGAGGSYDSFPDAQPQTELQPGLAAIAGISRRHGRPPLTNELFTTRFESFVDDVPEATALLGRLRRLTRDEMDIEAYLEEVQRDAERDPELLRQLAAIQMYIFAVVSACSSQWTDETHGVTNYAELVERLRQWALRNNKDHCYTTFNYDDLLDRAWAERHQRRLENIDDYLAPPSLIHPHGSINWYRPILNLDALFDLPADSNEFRNRLQMLDPRDLVDALPKLSLGNPEYSSSFGKTRWVQNWSPLIVGFPAIVIPLKTKSSFVCPPTHIAHLQDKLHLLTRVLIVGWRAGEDHFLQLWHDHQGDANPRILLACGRGDAGKGTAERLKRSGIHCSIEIFDGGFSRLVESKTLSEFLGE